MSDPNVPTPLPDNPLPDDYDEGNSYVEDLGGIDLLANDDYPGPEVPELTNNDPEEIGLLPEQQEFYDEQRRVAALATAQTLNVNNVGQLLLAAEAIENWLRTGTITP